MYVPTTCPAGARLIASFDVARISACRRGCNCSHDLCNAYRVFVHRTSHLSHRHLLVTLVLTAGPALFIAIVENQPGVGRTLALILVIAQFIVPTVTSFLES